MLVKSKKAKGRRLQDLTANMICTKFNLVRNVDLRTRIMGEAGSDIEFLSDKAKSFFTYNNKLLHIECKNIESWSFDTKSVWQNKLPYILNKLSSSLIRKNKNFVIVFSKNNGPVLALSIMPKSTGEVRLWPAVPRTTSNPPYLAIDKYIIEPFDVFLKRWF